MYHLPYHHHLPPNEPLNINILGNLLSYTISAFMKDTPYNSFNPSSQAPKYGNRLQKRIYMKFAIDVFLMGADCLIAYT